MPVAPVEQRGVWLNRRMIDAANVGRREGLRRPSVTSADQAKVFQALLGFVPVSGLALGRAASFLTAVLARAAVSRRLEEIS